MKVIHMDTEAVQALVKRIQQGGDDIGDLLREYYSCVSALEFHWDGPSSDEFRRAAMDTWRALDILRGRIDELSRSLNQEHNQWLEMDSFKGDTLPALPVKPAGMGEAQKRVRTAAQTPDLTSRQVPYEKVVQYRLPVTRGTGRTVWRAYYRDESGALVHEDLPYRSNQNPPTHRNVPLTAVPNLPDFGGTAADAAVSKTENLFNEGYIAKGNLINDQPGQVDSGPSLKWQKQSQDPGFTLDNGVEQIPGFGDLESHQSRTNLNNKPD